MASGSTKEALSIFSEYLESHVRNRENYNVMINLMDEFERARQNWADAEEKVKQKDIMIHQLEADLLDRDNKIKTLQAELKDARSQVRDQLLENKVLRSENHNLMKHLKDIDDLTQEESLKVSDEILDKIRQPMITRSQSVHTSSGTTEMDDTNSSTIDYDHTDDSYDDATAERSFRRSRDFNTLARQRRSTSLQPRPTGTNSKRRTKGERYDHVPAKKSRETSKPPTAPKARPNGTSRLTTRNRSMSENSLAIDPETCKPRPLGAFTQQTTSTMDLRSTPRSLMKQSWTRNSPICSRQHSFERFTNCDVCSASINFAAKPAVKCVDCQQIVHSICKRRLPLPCVPRLTTPLKKKDGQNYTLTEFCPPSAPMIAGPIIHLVTALEKKGLEAEGIYRVPGTKAQVARTLNELRNSRAIPNLSMQHVEILGDCIKLFLRELRDPLIPKSSKEEFIRAARKSECCPKLLNTAICDLPQPNRDTLAYLILHWQKVMALSEINKMPKENIARCLSMSVMMGQKQVPDLGTATKETGDCERVLVELLSFPSQYWMRFLTENAVLPPVTIISEREESSGTDCSMLGPVTSVRRGPQQTSRRQYFADP